MSDNIPPYKAPPGVNHHLPVQTLSGRPEDPTAPASGLVSNVLHMTAEPQNKIINMDFETAALCAILSLEQAETVANTLLEMVRVVRGEKPEPRG